jgi:hypothetical protein
MYVLTPRGLEEKMVLSVSFLRRKIAEYEPVFAENESLRKKVLQRETRASRSRFAPTGITRHCGLQVVGLQAGDDPLLLNFFIGHTLCGLTDHKLKIA